MEFTSSDDQLHPMDTAVEKAIWETTVPVEFSLSENEIAVPEKPVPVYGLIPRISYLGFYVKVAEKYFRRFTTLLAAPAPATEPSAGGDALWLSYKGKPVSWHLPVGVLIDSLTVPCKENATMTAPLLQLTVHFQNFPHDTLVPLRTDADVFAQFKHSLKQACSVRFGSAKPVLTLSAGDLTSLCESVRDNSLETFRRISRNMGEGCSQGQERVPVRIFLCKSAEPPKSLLKASTRQTTLQELLHSALPTVFSNAETGSGSSQARVLIHGFSPLLHTPLSWLEEHCQNPDFWINIVVLT